MLPGLLLCWTTVARSVAVLQGGGGGGPGVPEQTTWPGPEQTPVIVLQALFQRGWGGEGTSNVTCQGVNLVIWTSVTWHMGDTHRGSRSEAELPPTPIPGGDLVTTTISGLLL